MATQGFWSCPGEVRFACGAFRHRFIVRRPPFAVKRQNRIAQEVAARFGRIPFGKMWLVGSVVGSASSLRDQLGRCFRDPKCTALRGIGSRCLGGLVEICRWDRI